MFFETHCSNNVCSQTPGGPGTRGTDSWLHDTDSYKNVGPDLLLKVLMFNMHEIWSFDSQKNY